MEIAESALAMTAKNKIHTKIAGLAKPQNTKKHTHKITKKYLPPAHATTQSHTLRRMSHRRRHILMTMPGTHNHISSKVESCIVTPLPTGCLGES